MSKLICKKRSFSTKTEQLKNVNEFIEQCCNSALVNAKNISKLTLIAEEVFVNIASYSYKGNGTVELTVIVNQNHAVLEFCDYGEEFNPLKQELPDTSANSEERSVGGLGIFLVRRLSDNVKYERKDNTNILTITKLLGGGTK